jgi:outer membrane receptor protein involved in Fe transport
MQLALAEPQPHFVAAWAPTKEREAERSVALAGRVSLALRNVPLDVALKDLTNRAGLRITYSAAVLPAGKRVTIHASDVAVVTALTEMLFRSGLDVVVDQDGTLALVPCRHKAVKAEAQDTGAIVGRVTDKGTGAALVGATVDVEGSGLTATTDEDGEYTIREVPGGRHIVHAKYIGYTAASASVSIVAAEQVRVDLELARSVQHLNELVAVTPGGVRAEIRAVPSPVTVISEEDLTAQRPQSVNDVFRRLVPSAVGFDLPAQPATTVLSLRGANSLAGTGAVKVFVDGIESANNLANPVDPESIDRIEVIRGPQAGTIYGPDAAGGVLQIFTKRGDPSLAGPLVVAKIEGGVQETPYRGVRGAVRQTYSAAVRGGTGAATYNLGANYSRLSDWLPNGDASRQSIPSVFGGLNYEAGILALDLSARYLITDHGTGLNPLVLQTGFLPLSQPRYFDQRSTNRTIGSSLAVRATPWWRNRLTVGFDESSIDGTQQRPRLTTPDDSLLTLFGSNSAKIFVGYNSELTWASRDASLSASLTTGIDHYRLTADETSTTEALNVDGTISLAPGGSFNVSRSVTTNTGYFAQVTMGVRGRVFVTVGLRADDNSEFGTDLGVPVSPRAGLTYSLPAGDAEIKTRVAYGRSIRAPLPGLAFGSITPGAITLPNRLLAPERQRGWEGGVDIAGADVTFSVTGYDQTAEDLILLVPMSADPVFTDQYQNVGAVRNRGIEVEGALAISNRVRLRGQYAYVRSRIDDLGPGFSGDERVGDRPRGVPKHSAGFTATLTAWEKTVVTGGVTWVGSFRQYDQLALFSCFAGTQSCPASFDETGSTRDFIVTYPGFAKLNVSVTHQIAPQIDGIVSIDNLTNNTAYEGSNILAVRGRLTSVGLEARF